MTSLVERLGYSPDSRILMITSESLGSCHAANAGVYQSLREGLATSSDLMIPCPWAREAVSQYRGEDVGVQLTLNSELDIYRWGPITQAPSLLDGDGGFPRTVAELWDHGDLDEVRRECRTQIERAILWGFDISHLGTHLGALALRPEFFDVYLELALDFRLPLRLPDQSYERIAGFPFRRIASQEGLVFPDHVVDTDTGDLISDIRYALGELPPGVIEITSRPAIDTPELRSLLPQWERHTNDYDGLVNNHDIREELERSGAELIGYRPLRELLRQAI